MSLDQRFRAAVAEFFSLYDGPKLSVVVTGGGVSLADIAKVPGASRVLYALDIPYAEEAVSFLLGFGGAPHGHKSVSLEIAELLAYEAQGEDREGSPVPVVVTAALVTDRARRGDNHAYVAVGDRTFHVTFGALLAEEHARMEATDLAELRLAQDVSICVFVLNTLLGHGHRGVDYRWVDLSDPSMLVEAFL